MDIARLKGYLFDLDGTLLASTRFWHEAYGKALARFGVEMPVDYVEHVNHLNIASGTAYTAERFGIEGGAASVERVWRGLGGGAPGGKRKNTTQSPFKNSSPRPEGRCEVSRGARVLEKKKRRPYHQ